MAYHHRLNHIGSAFMNHAQQQMILENLVATMTSGIKQSGATYQLPESMAIEFGRLCYNQAVKDVMLLCTMSDFGQTGLEINDAMQDLNILQRNTP